jgi:Ca2+-binding EF-hand superfamily protein
VVAHQMLAIADRNQDGKVSKEELVDIMLTRM